MGVSSMRWPIKARKTTKGVLLCRPDLVPCHGLRKRWSVPDKRDVGVASFGTTNSHEAIEIQLALEGLVLGLVEVRLHDIRDKCVGLVNLEGLAAILPVLEHNPINVCEKHSFTSSQHSTGC
jgi:hypothetical protein